MTSYLRGLEQQEPSSSFAETDNWMQMASQQDLRDDDAFTKQRFGLFVFLVAGSVAIVLVAAMLLREFYWRKYGIDVCPGMRRPRNMLSDGSRHGNHHAQAQQQLESDRELAEALQRQLNEEEREVERQAKRKERRLWYESYIIPFTTSAKEEDFFYAHEMHPGNATETNDSSNNKSRFLRKYTSTMSEDAMSSEEEDEPQSNPEDEDEEEPVLCQQDDDDAHLYLKLPVHNKCGNPRIVDAHCAICYCEYQVDDKIAWSGLECQHAFHDECILPWLAKGKKRCPICRHWFVPGTRIDDQKKELEARLRRESSMSQEAANVDASTRTVSTVDLELGASHSLSIPEDMNGQETSRADQDNNAMQDDGSTHTRSTVDLELGASHTSSTLEDDQELSEEAAVEENDPDTSTLDEGANQVAEETPEAVEENNPDVSSTLTDMELGASPSSDQVEKESVVNQETADETTTCISQAQV